MDHHPRKRPFADADDNAAISHSPKRQRTDHGHAPVGSYYEHGSYAAETAASPTSSTAAIAGSPQPTHATATATTRGGLPEFDGNWPDIQLANAVPPPPNDDLIPPPNDDLITPLNDGMMPPVPDFTLMVKPEQMRAELEAIRLRVVRFHELRKRSPSTHLRNMLVGIQAEMVHLRVRMHWLVEKIDHEEGVVAMNPAGWPNHMMREAAVSTQERLLGMREKDLVRRERESRRRQTEFCEKEARFRRAEVELQMAQAGVEIKEVELERSLRKAKAVAAREAGLNQQADSLRHARQARDAERERGAEFKREAEELKKEVEALKREAELKSETALVREAELKREAELMREAALKREAELTRKDTTPELRHQHSSATPSTLNLPPQRDQTAVPSSQPASPQASGRQSPSPPLPPSPSLPPSRARGKKTEPRAPLRARTGAGVTKKTGTHTKTKKLAVSTSVAPETRTAGGRTKTTTTTTTGTTRSGRAYEARRLSRRRAGAAATLYELDPRGYVRKL